MQSKKLKLYYFPSNLWKCRDKAILSVSKKMAIKQMGDDIVNFYRSKIKIIDYKITKLSGDISFNHWKSDNHILFVKVEIEVSDSQYEHLEYDSECERDDRNAIYESNDKATQLALLKLFKEQMNIAELWGQ